jgi:hypothetical protein
MILPRHFIFVGLSSYASGWRWYSTATEGAARV